MIGAREIAVALVTIDRSPARNFLAETLGNLDRAGVLRSPLLRGVYVADSKPGGWAHFTCELAAQIAREHGAEFLIDEATERRLPNLNVARALRMAGESGAPWVIFIEDDVDFCARFLESAALWLDRHARATCPLYAFGASYRQIEQNVREGRSEYVYPVSDFYGTQTLALRSHDALDLAEWLETKPFGPLRYEAYDLHAHGWARSRKVATFLASAPSFVQHIGTESILSPRPESQIHRFESWPGREWSYAGAAR